MIIKFNERASGFTLIEILVALFIFSILCMLMLSALHNTINLLNGTEKNAERLRKMQMMLLLMSRDIESSVNRPIYNAAGKEEPAFMGTPTSMTFTHTGMAGDINEMNSSALQRVNYYNAENKFVRKTWDAIDQAPTTLARERILNNDITTEFQYLDKNGKFQPNWNAQGQTRSSEPLPRAVNIIITVPQWGTLKQLYVIAAKSNLEKLKAT